MAFVSNGRGPRAASSCAEKEVHESIEKHTLPANTYSEHDEFFIPQIPDAVNIPPDALQASAWARNACGQFRDRFADFGSIGPTSFSLYPDPFSLAEAPREQLHRCDHPGCIMKFGRQSDLK